MRSHVIIVSLAAVLATAGAGPAHAGLVPEFGIKGGLNFSDVDIDNLDSSTRTGWVAGVYLDLATPLLQLQPEALVTSKGFKNGDLVTSNHELEYRSISLEVPVLVVLSLPLPAISPRVYAGPAVSFPLKSEVQLDGGDWLDIKDDTKSTWSVVAGAGVKLGPLGLEVRYDIGMTELNERPLGDVIESVGDDLGSKDLKDRTFSVLVSFGLN